MEPNKDTRSELDNALARADGLINELAAILPLADDQLAHDRRVANVRMAVPTAAIETAVAILDELGSRFGGFDAESARNALALESGLRGVAERLRLLVGRIEATMKKHRSHAAATATGLKLGLSGLARSDGSVIGHVKRLQQQTRRASPKRSKVDAQAPADGAAAAVSNGSSDTGASAPNGSHG